MTNRPDKFPDWATGDYIDPTFGTNNVVEPPTLIKDKGFEAGKQFPYNWANWLKRYTGLWVRYLDERLNKPESYSVGTVPSASARGAGAMIYVTDETGGAVLAFSDGIVWRRVTDRDEIEI
jgi:hypothetical protein